MIRVPILFLTLTGVALSAPVTEERVEHAGSIFRVVRTQPGDLRVVWKDDNGVPYRTFDRVQAEFARRGKTVSFLMNGGIFEVGGSPCGLHVENGRILHKLNLADAPGNFFLKPNGVFRIDSANGGSRAFVSSSESFRNDAHTQLAVQSGPLLLADGLRHPAFKEGSSNKLHRNGIGVDDQGRIVFAITDRGQYVNLWDFSGLFLKLGCRNALFLDGDISQMSVNPEKPVESNRFAAIFVIAD